MIALVACTRATKRSSCQALTVERSRISEPSSTCCSSGTVGPQRLSAQLSLPRWATRGAGSAGQPDHVVFELVTPMSRTPVNSPTWWSISSTAVLSLVNGTRPDEVVIWLPPAGK